MGNESKLGSELQDENAGTLVISRSSVLRLRTIHRHRVKTPTSLLISRSQHDRCLVNLTCSARVSSCFSRSIFGADLIRLPRLCLLCQRVGTGKARFWKVQLATHVTTDASRFLYRCIDSCIYLDTFSQFSPLAIASKPTNISIPQ